ncbi:MAG: Oxidoreductase [Geoglossum simile]|nr:MAG: Oxidoreductase [Geoglossum simile]
MLRPVSRLILRLSLPRPTSPSTAPRIPRRLVSTAPPAQKARSWKSSALRWALAIGGVYYYNTSDVFAEAPRLSQKPSSRNAEDAETLTIESISSKRHKSSRPSPARQDAQPAPTDQKSILDGSEESEDPSEGVQDLEQEADGQGAFNPETGEINWDCPCLGGMAHGPCGEEFKTAFSCFVYSKEEPKGMDCIEKFKGMQDCFRKYPEIYGEELDEDEEGRGDRDSGDNGGIEDVGTSPLPSTEPPDHSSGIETPEKVPDIHPLPSTPNSGNGAAKSQSGAEATRQNPKPIEPENESIHTSRAPHTKHDDGDKQ